MQVNGPHERGSWKREDEDFNKKGEIGIASRILCGLKALLATLFTLGAALASPTIRNLWYSAFTGRVTVLKSEDLDLATPASKTNSTFSETVAQKEPNTPVTEPSKPAPEKSTPPSEVAPDSGEKQAETLFKSEEEIKKIFREAKSKPHSSETKILKNRLREIIEKYYKIENTTITEDDWERSIELFAKIYNIVKKSYGDIAIHPKQNILQRTDMFVCLEDEDINLLRKNKSPFTLANTWMDLLWFAFANVEATPIQGIKIQRNMYDLTPLDMAKLFTLAYSVVHEPS